MELNRAFFDSEIESVKQEETKAIEHLGFVRGVLSSLNQLRDLCDQNHDQDKEPENE